MLAQLKYRCEMWGGGIICQVLAPHCEPGDQSWICGNTSGQDWLIITNIQISPSQKLNYNSPVRSQSCVNILTSNSFYQRYSICAFFIQIFSGSKGGVFYWLRIFSTWNIENIKLKLWNVSAESGRDRTDNDEGPMDSPMSQIPRASNWNIIIRSADVMWLLVVRNSFIDPEGLYGKAGSEFDSQ